MSRLHLAFRPYLIPFRQRVQTASETYRERHGFWLEVWDEAGGTGFGEVAPLEAFGTESLAAARAGLERLSEEGLCSPSIWTLEGIAIALQRAGIDRTATPALHAGVELALLDAHTRSLGVPLARFLNLAARPRVAIQRLLVGCSSAELAQETTASHRAGFETFKLKIGAESLEFDAERLEIVRSQLPPASTLRLDANGAYDLQSARIALGMFAKLGIDYLEQPLTSAPVTEYEALRDLGVRIAADEALLDPNFAQLLISRRAVDVLILKPTLLGGLGRAVSLAREASKQHLRCVVTSSLERHLGVAAALHLAAALPQETSGLGTLELLASDDALALPIEAGFMRVPTLPGLGVMPPAAERPRRAP